MSVPERAKQDICERLKALKGAGPDSHDSSPQTVEDAEAIVLDACRRSLDNVAEVHEHDVEPSVNLALKQLFLDTKAVHSICNAARIVYLHYVQRPIAPVLTPSQKPPAPWLQRLLDNHSDPGRIQKALQIASESFAYSIKDCHDQHTYRLLDSDRELIVARVVHTQRLGEGFIEFARAWVGEMERFLLLKAATGDTEAEILSPSGYVDAAWHELILETRMYSMHCERLLNKAHAFIHHNPDGAMDSDRGERYRKTYEMYEHVLGEKPPDIAWDRP